MEPLVKSGGSFLVFLDNLSTTPIAAMTTKIDRRLCGPSISEASRMPRDDPSRRRPNASPSMPPILPQVAEARARGVHVWCPRCGHQATLLLEPLIARVGAGALFPDVRRRLRRSRCGARPVDAAPNYLSVIGLSARHGSPN